MQGDTISGTTGLSALPNSNGRLSYKFQRLREQLRNAILSGEFVERLPGERELGRRFKANAKTINKALCDLSSEGLVIRHIGRGTFVAGKSASNDGETEQRLLLLVSEDCDASTQRSAMLTALRSALGAGSHGMDVIPCQSKSNDPIGLAAWPSGLRRSTAGLFAFPKNPISSCIGRLADDCIAEAIRRQTPVVVLGAAAPSVKTYAVLPDFVDAGYRLAEHLFLSGCDRIVAVVPHRPGREVDLAWSGCQTASARFGREVTRISLAPSDDGFKFASPKHNGNHTGSRGIICVGEEVLSAVLASAEATEGDAGRLRHVCCISDSSDGLVDKHNITSYEVSAPRIAEWGVKLMLGHRQGARPVEVFVPGCLRIRGVSQANGQQGSHRDVAGRPSKSELLEVPLSEVLI